MQKVFYGKQNSGLKMKDLSVRESIVLGAMVIVIVYLGLFPQSVINTAKPSVLKTLNIKEQSLKTGRIMPDYESFDKFLNQEASNSDKYKRVL